MTTLRETRDALLNAIAKGRGDAATALMHEILGPPWVSVRADAAGNVYQHDSSLASGTEAQRATTVQQGVVHDGPVAESDAPSPSPDTPEQPREDSHD
jgi:hypothetical protein